MRLDGKRAVVTGGISGIGRAIAEAFRAEGARVAVLDMRVDGIDAGMLGVACDISDSASVDAAFARIDSEFGGVDVLVNNAGTGQGPNDGSAELYAAVAERQAQIARGETPRVYPDQTIHMSDEGWRRVIGVNLDGAFWCARAALRLMARDGTRGSIVNIASTSAASGEGPIHYVTSKAAIVGLTRGLAREVAPRGIRVNAIHPGPTNTPIMQSVPDEAVKAMEAAVPLGRMAQPAEIAAAAVFLASDQSSYATGSTVTVNGGSYFV
ncbi:SDR family NAD(P)-dependent oxidoreductase [Sphingomonas lycopersici]|uniref:SDR family oxidoreductase n=1 Tax=Sphingomonas lycopersici TaxID=2951807 RepID=A0AA42CPZ2_9SPHN|nr:SDR family NAD(P)-dependent oxidoreductase [Sphingomonas lycopersici]MCW6534769.1 SDR family oxidoreductase [Sphingomonas lycopersici]